MMTIATTTTRAPYYLGEKPGHTWFRKSFCLDEIGTLGHGNFEEQILCFRWCPDGQLLEVQYNQELLRTSSLVSEVTRLVKVTNNRVTRQVPWSPCLVLWEHLALRDKTKKTSALPMGKIHV
eukprot:3244329-Amphidinium_carterae.1